jgi:hypothetical protein
MVADYRVESISTEFEREILCRHAGFSFSNECQAKLILFLSGAEVKGAPPSSPDRDETLLIT